MSLPRVQVFVFDLRLGHSHWVDYISHARTLSGLIRELKKQVKSGVYVGYRLVHIHWECLGVVEGPGEAHLKSMMQFTKESS